MMLQSSENCEDCKTNKSTCDKCQATNIAFNYFYNANVPFKYWTLNMIKFEGDQTLLNKYKLYSDQLSENYNIGKSLLLTGSHGNGKTMTACNILKQALIRGYTGQYLTLNDVVINMVNSSSDKAELRKWLLEVDFLIIDEFDPRYIRSENGAALFGGIFEDIFRTRIQNTLPTLLCTNSPDVLEAFKGPLFNSIKSLLNYIEKIVVLGKDMRKDGK